MSARTVRLVASGALAVVLLAFVRRARAHNEPCAVRDGEDPCFQGEACTVQDGGAGICLPPPCASDAQCTAPLDKCALGRGAPVCVQCRSDADCDAGSFCELDPRLTISDRCVECEPGRAGACAGSAAGHLCFPQRGVCGCRADDDCPTGAVCRRNTCTIQTVDRDAGVDAGSPADAGAPPPPTTGYDAAGCALAGGSRRDGDERGALAASLAGIVAIASAAACVRRRDRTRR